MNPNEKMKASIRSWVASTEEGKGTFRPMLMDPDCDMAFCALGEGMSKDDSEMITASIIDLLEQMVGTTFP